MRPISAAAFRWVRGGGNVVLNAAVFGGYNSYDTSRQGLAGSVTGNTDGAEFSTLIGVGYDFHFGNFRIGPLDFAPIHPCQL